MQPTSQPDSVESLDIAVIGMAGRFPGANNVLEYWENLKLGVESIRFFSESESLESGISPEMLTDPNFVAAGGPLEHEYDFDAEFFDFNPRDAEITDPQQRIMLECAWEALESAGYDPQTYDGRIGIYAGNSLSAYFLYSLLGNPQVMASAGLFQLMTAADKDFLATRAAYKLGLTGPAMTVQTACSTSLVAINMACQSLLSYQSDIMLAGGSSITPRGRVYAEGFMFSPDGKCRAFDTLAQGTVCGNGVGLVVLKRLADALADGDHIHAVIKGTAVNNDGMRKVGISAPSVSGQAEAILDAQTMANVDADTITYIESHGTGTQLGDPIEIAALTQAFRNSGTERTQFCAIGSTKPNIGHLDTAAGVAGLIKAVLSVEHAQLAPSLHFTEANPKLDLEHSPFFINAELRDWKTEGFPRRAGVSAFGFGGTNAHTILEQAPDRAPTPAPSRDWQLLPVSGRDEHALRDNMRRLGAYLESAPAVRLTDVAHTLQVGRRGFAKRAYVLARNTTEAAAALTANDPARIVRAAPRDVTVAAQTVFMFSGQGSQHIHMCRDLFEGEPLFRTALVEVAGLMRPHLDIDLLTLLYPRTDGQDAEQATATLNQTRYTQPALFAIEYALARLWMAWGIQPEAMIGHSIGEYVAACLAGVLTLADAARLVCLRGKLIQEQAPGAMLSVPLGEQALLPLLTAGLSLAAVNAPALCVVSGDTESIEALRLALQARGIEGRRLHVSHAFHSHMLDAAARAFETLCAGVPLSAPTLRYVSNVTGRWITPEQATSPRYWADHLRQAVRFSDGLQTLLADRPEILLEVGPGQSLTALARQHRDSLQGAAVVPTARHPLTQVSDVEHLVSAVGAVWGHGAAIDWRAFHGEADRRRLPLPTYAFQRQRYFLPPVYQTADSASPSTPALAQPAASARPADLPYDAPSDDDERMIAGIWETMLGIRPVGVHDDFFKLGGHSLLATQLIAEIRRVSRTDLSMQHLFASPTVAGLASHVATLRAENADVQIDVIPQIPRDGQYQLSYHQETVLEFERAFSGTVVYNGFVGLRLRGELDRAALEFAIDEILRRHEVMRTSYAWLDGRYSITIQPPRHVPVVYHDLSHLSEDDQQARMIDIGNQLIRTTFDFSRDLYLRPIVIRLGAREHMLLVASHYVAVDGWTIGLVIQELASHYAAHRTPGAPRLPEMPFQGVDYAAYQRARVNDAFIAGHLPYWRQQLAGIPAQHPVTPDRLRTPHPTMTGATHHFKIDHVTGAALRAFDKANGSTVFLTFLTALYVLYREDSGNGDIVIGAMTGERETGMESSFGAYVNCLPLRVTFDADHTFFDVMAKVRQAITGGFNHQVPFDKLVAGIGADMVNAPLFRSVFVLRNVPCVADEGAGLEVSLADLPIDRAVSDCDLSLYLLEDGDGFRLYFEYSDALFDRQTIASLSARFVDILTFAVSQPSVPLKARALSSSALSSSDAARPTPVLMA